MFDPFERLQTQVVSNYKPDVTEELSMLSVTIQRSRFGDKLIEQGLKFM